ncbi:MAG: discoidin domain-containing protein [Phycisphaerales bacterium]|nr:MAG: discoidin domain-containing protein [Phycisphaerales bacterium]
MFKKLVRLSIMLLILGWMFPPCVQAGDPSLVGWWKLDDGSGTTAVDSSGNASHGTLNGTLEWVAGVIDGALQFDGATGYVQIPANSNQAVINKGDFSMMAWIRTTDTTATNYVFQQQDRNGTGRSWLYTINGVINTYVGVGDFSSGFTVELNEWYHAALTVVEGGSADTIQFYVNGEPSGNPTQKAMETCEGGYLIGSHKGMATGSRWPGAVDDVRLYNRALSAEEIQVAMLGIPPELASEPVPADKQTDVPRDATLAWTAGTFAAMHDVYLGTNLDDVNNADRGNPLGVLLSQGQTATSLDTGRLEFGQTYYWRVDEVNSAPDNTLFQGEVWSFTTELLAYPIENVTAVANGTPDEGAEPENVVNGSGLNTDDQHSTEIGDMWAATPSADEPLTLEFAFDGVYKLHQMLVWNYNVQFELLLGFGVKNATIEYSPDGADWVSLGEVELAQATAQERYTANTTIDFAGVAARYVRLTVNSSFGVMGKSGLSEVRFLSIPVHASAPQPADGTTDVSANAEFAWRPGREAAAHNVYLGTDPNALELIDSVAASAVDPGPLDLAATYCWRVDEVNEAEAISTWEGQTWSFATEAFIAVEDFESYDDEDNRIYDTWIDGWINETGSTVGYLEEPFAEQTIVRNGAQSMPLFYDNTGGLTVSEAELTFDTPQDFSANGIQSLALFVYGQATNNGGQLYLKIDNTEVMYGGVADVLQRPQWVPWIVDLAAAGANLSSVTSLTLGIEGAGSSGLIFVDDIRLYPQAAEWIEPALPPADDPNLAAYYEFEGNTDDSTGNYPGDVVGEPGYAAGKVGQAIELDAIVDYVVHPFDQEEVWPAYSVSLWARTDALGQPQYSGLFNNNSSSADFQIDLDGTDPGNYHYRGSSSAVLGPVTTEWVHLAVSCDGVTTDLYYNGLLVTTLNVADTRFGQIAVGVNRAVDNQFAGLIDEIRVFNRALSDAEVAGLADLSESIVRPF